MTEPISEDILNKLKEYLQKNIYKVKGEILKKNSGYDNILCDILNDFKVDTNRYWDAIWIKHNIYIEFKKGKSIWLDLVRYSEIFLKLNTDAKKETITLFFVPNSKRDAIDKIICLRTSILISKLKLDEKQANFLLRINTSMPRSFNAQASLTVNDVQKIADFIVPNSNSQYI
ncbi:hypothetical protein EDL99_01125 [Ornithobacterium rhinotracheale]|uniref:hypothetical protein n=1 Tax=Ornithobacterium rhinotracheale TaxID=28251 RepID=UPI00129C8D8E|nr:hypothetical protein [Ornithobacterium rhinotracheale]MRJ07489.1 hypothetical protein [Ornithobacterium rhinotracheale]UOH78083.1 hypothetical protein MT996_01120 [Ornithobacterium rhinotracheale]